ncbi:S9 family peptidase [Frigoribacterium sp. CG_9.8]|uniref:S9 family peptidase n=1 Tax=Frigoribacterium sp. CG_9.8 TaxID=2787733 RepID=UPI0018CBB821|nr:S9 family peptidase [Frigoribacterium sp. CG_9.8]MBG6107913.1 dipeptidyl aminopeptidase/acylaminoacyl peptidase [Frigoribacterium sp. CG_9.8]
MKPSDLPLLSTVSRPTIHPDGSRAVVAVSRPDLDADRTVGQLWSVDVGVDVGVDVDGSGARRITRGISDSYPQFSPDGALLAFVRSPTDGPAQLYVMAAPGGEPVQLTDQKLGIGIWRWSPDSRKIAFTAAVAEDGRYGTVAHLGPGSEPPRRISTLKYRSNGFGYTTDRRRQVFLIDVPSVDDEPGYPTAPSAEHPEPDASTGVPLPRRLTEGDFDHGALAFSPDGRTLAVVSARHPDRDRDLANNVYELTLETPAGELPAAVQVTGHHRRYGISSVEYSPSGELWFIGADLGERGIDFVGRGDQLWVQDAATEAARRLTDSATVQLDGELIVTAEGALVHRLDRGRVHLLRIALDGTVTALVTGDLEVHGTAASHNASTGANTIVVSYTTPSSMGELGLVTASGSHPLTDFSAGLRRGGVTPLQELSVTAHDGSDVHGWVLTPIDQGEPHPVLLVIHGGPFAQWGVSFFDEAQVYVDAGYAVVMCNPRGSAGYGEVHGRATRQRMGTVDFTDVIDFLEGALSRHPALDRERIGVMGGSYGGYLTAWIIANDHRFAGAIVERGYLDPETFVGTSDIGSFFSDEYTGTDPQRMRQQSPQALSGQVTTPTLVIHSEDDLRCPLSQGERFYAALKRNGVETELLIFPGENHELSRSGRPRHRVQRFEAVLDWWARYLPSVANPGIANPGVTSPGV